MNYDLIVVDNASQDGTAAFVASRFPDVRLIRNRRNIGFAAANNIALQHARGEIFWLLNPDTVLTCARTLERMVAVFVADHAGRIGAAGCRLENADGRPQIGDAGYWPTPWNAFRHFFFLSRVWPRSPALFVNSRGHDGQTPVFVDWVCGGCMFVRREAWAAAGNLNDKYFLYGEDVEWGCRMRRHGYSVVWLPDVVVLHEQGATQTGRPSTRWVQGMMQAASDLNNPFSFFVFRLIAAAGFGMRALIALPAHLGRRKGSRATYFLRCMLVALRSNLNKKDNNDVTIKNSADR